MTFAVDVPCMEVLPVGGDHGSTRFYCGKESEYRCSADNGQGRCLAHSHTTSCCMRMFWPDDADHAEGLGWPEGQYERILGGER